MSPLAVQKGSDEEERWGKEWQARAQKLGLTALTVMVKDVSEYADAFAMFIREDADAMFVGASPLNVGNAKLITNFALKQRLPILTNSNTILKQGGLIRYWTQWSDLRRQSAFYVDKILKGAKPGDLPVERPRKFELRINLKTAQTLGITIPPEVLLQADKVIR